MKKALITLTLTLLLVLSSVISYGGERGITMNEAINIATKVVPGEVIKAELERGLYEIKILTEDRGVEKVYVDAKDGSLIKKKNITLDEAIAIATRETLGDVVKVEFEKGRYEIKIRTPNGWLEEVYVNARDGSIIKKKRKKKRKRSYDDD